MKRQETVRLSCTKQMGSARSSMRTTHPFHCHLRRLFTLISPAIWWAESMLFVLFLCYSTEPSIQRYEQAKHLGGISSSVLSVFFTDKFYKLLKSLHLIGWEQICLENHWQNAWWNAPQVITSKARDQLQVRAHWWRDARISLSHC